MNQGIILALTSMLANSGHDIAMQQNAQKVKGDRNKFLFVLSVVSLLIGLTLSIINKIDLFKYINIFYGFVCGIVAFCGYYAYLISMYGQNRTVYIIFIRLSFILSIVFSFLFFGDEANIYKILAILLCCAAMLLLSLKEKNDSNALESKPSFRGIFKDKYFLAAAVACLFLATLNTVNKYAANDNVDTFAVLFWRYVTFSLILLPILVHKHFKSKKTGNSPKILATPKKAQFFLYAALGGIMIFVGICAMIEAMKHNDVSVILPISQLSFVSTMFLNKLIYKEKMTKLKYAGAAIAFLSIMIVSFR